MKVKLTPDNIHFHSMNQSCIIIGVAVNLSSFKDRAAFDEYCREVMRQMEEAFRK